MKKILLILLCVPLIGMGQDNKKVDISKIDNVCELLNEVEIVIDNMLDFVERNGRDGEKASKVEIEEWRTSMSKLNKLSSFSRENMKWKERMKDCSIFVELEEKTYQLSSLIGIKPLNTLLFEEIRREEIRD